MAAAEGLTVVVAMRPLTRAEAAAGHQVVWEHETNVVWQSAPVPTARGVALPWSRYRVDSVYSGDDESAAALHRERVAPLVQRVLRGFNAVVMAYGQTSSGKTTMIRGQRGGGLVSKCVRGLLDGIAADADPGRWALSLSYLEIYNESVNDLLNGACGLALFDQKDGGLRVADLTEVAIADARAAEEALERGDRRRHIGATALNERSSRAHVVCQLRLRRRATVHEPTSAVAELNLVDLAGSERVSPHARGGAAAHTRGVEGGHINRSLLVLSSVIQKLAEASAAGGASGGGGKGGGGGGGGGVHVPYRSSKITRMLQPSLSGDAYALIVCTITPASAHSEETHNTLRFATRAKQVAVAPTSHARVDAVLLAQQREEQLGAARVDADGLRKELAAAYARLAELQHEHAADERQQRAHALARAAAPHDAPHGGPSLNADAADADAPSIAAAAGANGRSGAGLALVLSRPALHPIPSSPAASPLKRPVRRGAAAAAGVASSWGGGGAAAGGGGGGAEATCEEHDDAASVAGRLVDRRNAERFDEQGLRLRAAESALARSDAQLAEAEGRVAELAAELHEAYGAQAASEERAEAAVRRAVAAEAACEGLQAEVATLAAAAREVATFEREAAEAARHGLREEEARGHAREAALREGAQARMRESIAALEVRHETALTEAIEARETTFKREREAIRRAAARERQSLVKAAERAEAKVAQLEASLGAEREARAHEARAREAAQTAEEEAMARAARLEVQLEHADATAAATASVLRMHLFEPAPEAEEAAAVGAVGAEGAEGAEARQAAGQAAEAAEAAEAAHSREQPRVEGEPEASRAPGGLLQWLLPAVGKCMPNHQV